ncbi:MAG: flagellar hook-associated protein FlgL [bacterium]|jgi:flagellar hook-associated protein 3 FlgL|nr:flagellar hook-associated protein FlgL [bacterium]
MRITNQMKGQNSLLTIERRGQAFEAAQRRITTGKRVEKPSDDAAGSSRILKLRSSLARNLQYQRNLDTARMRLGHAELSLQRVTDQLDEVRAFAVQAATDTLTPEDRVLLAQEVDQLLESLSGEANRRFLGHSLYAGSRVDKTPFAVVRDEAGRISQVTAVLESQEGRILVPLSENEDVQVNFRGTEVFMGGVQGSPADIFHTLVALRDGLLAGEGAAPGASLERIDATIGAVNGARAALGTRMQRVEATEIQLFSREEMLSSNLGEVEDADLAEAMMRATLEQTGYQAALKSISLAMSVSLLNFID